MPRRPQTGRVRDPTDGTRRPVRRVRAQPHDPVARTDGGPPADPFVDAAGNPVDRGEGPFPQSVAAGDPRPRSVVLWTRLATDAEAGLTLRVGRTPDLADPVAEASAVADPEDDGCVRVKVTGLRPGSRYYYRFEAAAGASPVGRFRTAPAPDDDRPVEFVLTNCQDYTGRYYNAYLPLLGRDFEFALHVGDFVYETTGHPTYQSGAGGRRVEFRDPGAAIEMEEEGQEVLAARSLSNYRDLYRAYRADPVQAAMQERVAFVHVWDDHEFTDDAYGATGTYFDERSDEYDPERRRNAERAFFEYVPIDPDGAPAGSMPVTDDDLYPDSRIYRDFRYGATLHLLLTDYRTYRPDHVVDEDAFPGAVVMDRSAVVATYDALLERGDVPPDDERLVGAEGVPEPDSFDPGDPTHRRRAAEALYGAADWLVPYVDLDDPAYADHRETLRELLYGAYGAEGVGEDRARRMAREATGGRVDATVVDRLVEEFGLDLPTVAAGDLPRGVSYATLGKASLFGALGSRFMVARRPFELYCRYRRYVLGDAAFDDVLGPDQSRWLFGGRGGPRGSSVPTNGDHRGGSGDATGREGDDGEGSTPRLGAHPDAAWKALVSSVSMTSMRLPLDDPPDAAAGAVGALPADYRRAFLLNCEQWDGFFLRRRDVFEALSAAGSVGADPTGTVVLSGDIHATFVTDHGTPADGGYPLHEFTAPALTSDTQERMVRNKAREAEALDTDLAGDVVDHLDALLRGGNGGIECVDTATNGVVTFRADGESFEATYHHLDPDLVAESHYDDPGKIAEAVERRRFRVEDGELRER